MSAVFVWCCRRHSVQLVGGPLGQGTHVLGRRSARQSAVRLWPAGELCASRTLLQLWRRQQRVVRHTLTWLSAAHLTYITTPNHVCLKKIKPTFRNIEMFLCIVALFSWQLQTFKPSEFLKLKCIEMFSSFKQYESVSFKLQMQQTAYGLVNLIHF